MLKTIENCGALAGELCCFLLQEQKIQQVCHKLVVDIKIIFTQLHLNGLAAMITMKRLTNCDAVVCHSAYCK